MRAAKFSSDIYRCSLKPLLCRTLFSFPSLPSFPSVPNGPQTYNESKIFNYSPRQLFDVVADVASYSSFVPFCNTSRVLKSSAHIRKSDTEPYTMEAELSVGFLSFNESYVSTVSCVPFKSVQAVASSSTPLFTNLSTTWKFNPVPLPRTPNNKKETTRVQNIDTSSDKDLSARLDNSDSENTLVTLDLTFAFANPLHAAVSSAFFGQVSRQMVQAFEKRCIDVYGFRRPGVI
ncbi:hypothetical protein K435DRAFT_708526 [Dendrothele bispora CBS 962.96]|uniref:Coenzyme Q-binding protein COQ10 START domain-containing protein n=1 Tax=Dendrothele bispora (strain CBS 962.96) TaxID=1314807 RepID=A0A4S8MYR7_DENBC|nr:hypothetical protein K435DRAFT_708526 [Dendrothele bispora CBS 962.96]